MNRDRIYSFVFRGLLSKEALDKTSAKSKIYTSNILEQDLIKRLSIEILDEDFVNKSRKMATVYTAISAFENYARDFISKKLLEEAGEKWWQTKVSEKIRQKAESRMEEEKKVRWHTQRGDSPINYTDFSELSSIITQNWEYFEPHLQSQEWVKQILNTLERSRNVIMHSGELVNEDIERIGSCIRDWVKQVGS